MSATTALSPARWVVQTKLRPPLPREDFVSRQGLLDALHGAIVSRRLTLVSAPAGYGKTTLLAALPRAFPDLPVAWLSLGGEDNDPAGFLAALVAALQRMAPGCADTAQIMLESLPNPGAEVHRVAGVLINDVSETLTEPFVVVLDDLHVIDEPAVHAALDYLIERKPEQMHLAAITRRDPPIALARLRARGQLAEFRPADLRFTGDEAATLLNDRLWLDLSADDLSALQARTEGWVAGLRLLAEPLDRIPTAERAAFIAQNSQVDRHVFDLMSEEVLDRQEPDLRDFLLETSILDELTPALCQAVTGRQDAARMLEEIYRHNLFMVALGEPEQRDDDGGIETREPAYRYHDLFAGFLRARLARERPDAVRELHRRAAGAQPDPTRAVHHYLAASMWPEAARSIEQVGPNLLYLGMLDRLQRSILTLPPEIREGRPKLAYLLGAAALRQGDFATARTLLERAERGFAEAGDHTGKVGALVELARVMEVTGGSAEEIWAQVEASPVSVPARYRLQNHIAQAWTNAHRHRWTEVDPHVAAAVDIALESGDPEAFGVLAMGLRAPLLLGPAGNGKIERYCHRALVRFGGSVNLVRAGSQSLLGYMHLLRGEIEEAEGAARSAREMGERLGGLTDTDAEIDHVLSVCALIRGNYEDFDRLWETRLPLIERHDILRTWLGGFLYWIGKAYWLQGRLPEARRVHSRLKTMEAPPNFPEMEIARTMMDGLMAMDDRRYELAERSFRRAVSMRPGPLYTTLFWIGDPRLLLAHLYHLWSRPRAELTELEPVLDAYERWGTPGLVLREGTAMVPLLRLAVDNGVHADFAGGVLEALGGSGEVGPLEVPTTGETLTPREVEVLRLVASGESNRNIAGLLFVSERTVKSHMTSILRKVDASSRTQAAARARDLRLI